MPTFINIHAPLAHNSNSSPLDVIKIKAALSSLGHYEAPNWGVSIFPDSALFDAIRTFQKSQGLKVDGVMKPGGETMWVLNSVIGDVSQDAQSLHGMGEYIWRTAGDGKVRSSHADRDGKTYSWDNPPEGGHPGEAPNCRCTAEDVEQDKNKCKELLYLTREARGRHDAIQKPILEADRKAKVSKSILRNLRSELSAVQNEMRNLLTPDRLDNVLKGSNAIGWGVSAYKYQQLKNREQELIGLTEIEERTLAGAKEKIEWLTREREQHHKTAEEYSWRYKACQKENG